jgi:hypothetical protein
MYNSDIIVVPHLRSTLLNTTALTPTQHGLFSSVKKFFKKAAPVIAIAAAVMTPYAASWAAGSFAKSAGLSFAANSFAATASSALAGAAMNAGVSYLTGGNVAQGAIGGAIAGGIGGYNAGNMGGTGDIGTNFTPGATTAGGGAPNIPLTTAPTGPVGGPTVDNAAGAPTPDLSNIYGTQSFGNLTLPTMDASTGAGATLSGSSAGVTPVASNHPGMTGGSFTGPNARPYYNPNTVSSQFNKFTAGLEGLPGKFMDSEAAQSAGGKLLTMGVANAFAGDEPDMSAYEQAKMAELQKARGLEQKQIANRQRVSDSYVQQAASVNPDAYAQQYMTDQQNRLGRAQAAGLRNINPRNKEAVARQKQTDALAKSRLGGYQNAYQNAQNQRLGLLQAAQNTAPTTTGAAGISKDLADYDSRYRPRAEDKYDDYASIVTPISEEIFGLDSEEERKRRSEQVGA